MKKRTFLLFVLSVVVLTSCNRIDSNLTGDWKLTESNYRITAQEDFTFVNVSGTPWHGKVRLNNLNLNPDLFSYHTDNVWGLNHLFSPEVCFLFTTPNTIEIIYTDKEKTYVLDAPYTFDISKGIFKAEGTAVSGNNQTLPVSVDMTMPQVTLKKGEQLLVKDFFREIPYENINLRDGGKLNTDYLVGDILYRLSGKWRVNNNEITISLKEYPTRTYQYQQNGNTLLLGKEKITGDELPYFIRPFSSKISRVEYIATYRRE